MGCAYTRFCGGGSDVRSPAAPLYGAEAAKYMGHVPDHVSESCIWPPLAPLGPLAPWGLGRNGLRESKHKLRPRAAARHIPHSGGVVDAAPLGNYS